MNAADIVVQPFKKIMTSGSVILAMSFGKPVIAPAIGCMPDILDNEGNFLYEPSDPNGLLKAMQLALEADLIKMGKHNFQLAKQYSWEGIAKGTAEIYRKCFTK
jgi:beta-1,4-mannosyltransferase